MQLEINKLLLKLIKIKMYLKHYYIYYLQRTRQQYTEILKSQHKSSKSKFNKY